MNILGFESHTVSVTVTQLCCYNTKATTDYMQRNGYGRVQIKLYLQKQEVARFSLWAEYADPWAKVMMNIHLQKQIYSQLL